MTWTLATLADFIGSLALLGLLSLAFGHLRRHVPGPRLAQTLLGLTFGAVAVLQMHSPLSPVDGLIVDMRNVPVALAGAFLGGRGLAICLLIAAGARFGIGGVGMWSGIAAMMIAGLAGAVWTQWTSGTARRGGWAMVALAAGMSLHIVAVLLLPSEVALWFLTEAAPVVLALNFASVPIIATLLERERLRAGRPDENGGDRDSLAVDPLALDRALAGATRSRRFDSGAVVVVLRLRRRWLRALAWGAETEALTVARLQRRLRAALPEGSLFGMTDPSRIVVVAPGTAGRSARPLLHLLSGLAEQPLRIGPSSAVRLPLHLGARHYGRVPALDRIEADLARRTAWPGAKARPAREDHDLAPGAEALFAVADRLLAGGPQRPGHAARRG
ncbi:LytS/YhcK type 5TM receptor domain-containing protein [Jannaschia ovalis]|uniref:LytS/YhcK type 5TM receptor domain-containing protein n=1 Tax=Jannaschia ovalis TaxID=3038773 RepID=A0ABY8LDL2_9RHOB|nr:LytS/YhcK type 5TM receptor domain-containing protein [Jannaschia sp. GRR-S6-38]WGH79406.1 LytS/YhcK type 5TM receptor domain-containing protein [Jannaschia sp. GRR-S6-38]